MYRQNYVTKEQSSLTMLRMNNKGILHYFLLSGMRRICDHYCIETVSPSGDHYCIDIVVIIIIVLPRESCPLNCALPMPGTADGDVVSRCQVLGRAGSVHHGADQ